MTFTPGQIAYMIIAEQLGWTMQWEDLSSPTKQAWHRAALNAHESYVQNKPKTLEERIAELEKQIGALQGAAFFSGR